SDVSIGTAVSNPYWTFTGSAASNSSGISRIGGTSLGPAAMPVGSEITQMAYFHVLPGPHTATQTVTLSAGPFVVNLNMSNRSSGATPATLEVLIDGIVVGSFISGSNTWAPFTTNQFTVAAGAHTLQLKGLPMQAGIDSTLFVYGVNILGVVVP